MALLVGVLAASGPAIGQSLDRITDRGLDRGRDRALERYRLDRAVDRGRSQGIVVERYSVSPAWTPDDNRYGGRPAGANALLRVGGKDLEVDFTRSVGQRDRPEGVNPQGGRLGSFRVFPRLSIGGAYDSNVYAVEDDPDGDFVATIEPSVTLRSDWKVHALNLGARGNFGRYADLTAQNYADYGFEADGVIEVQRGTEILASAAFDHGHIGRGSPDDVNASESPRTFDRSTAYLALSRSLGIYAATADVSATWMDFNDGETVAGANINHDDDDHVVVSPGLRVGYSQAEGDEIYVRARYVDSEFFDPTADGGPDRDNWGFDVIVGAVKTFDAVWRGEVFIGYAPRYFEDDRLEPIQGIDGLVGGLNVVWNPTARTSVLGNILQSTGPTVSGDISGIASTIVNLGIEHEVSRAVIVNGNVQYIYDDFVKSDREDDTFQFRLGADYTMNRYITFDLGYNFTSRDSNQPGSDYDRHKAGIGITLRY
ncbi:outer membrane beta-barrel protein [Roseospira navarrensis]|uniref:outer membrane beta-barrel protein n=1 Tax=Roseospira navarrensis TaxID=140058 RepID=UPI001478232C